MPPERFSSSSLERFLSATGHQPLCCQTTGNRVLDSQDTSTESSKPWLAPHALWWPEGTDFLGLKQTTSDETAFPRCPAQACVPLPRCCCCCSLFCAERCSCLHFPSPWERGNLSYLWPFSHSLITIPRQSHLPLVFPEGLEGSEFTSVFLSFELPTKVMVSEFATLYAVLLRTQLVPHASFEITILF